MTDLLHGTSVAEVSVQVSRSWRWTVKLDACLCFCLSTTPMSQLVGWQLRTYQDVHLLYSWTACWSFGFCADVKCSAGVPTYACGSP